MERPIALHTDKKPRRARLTLADRLAELDESIVYHEQKLSLFRSRRSLLITEAEKSAAAALAEAQAARGVKAGE